MRKFGSATTAELTRHFFRRLLENDVIESDGDTTTTLARALAMAAAPGLMFAFFLQNSYPQRTVWGRIEDQYFFVLFSFVTMAGVALFEWEMLFPEPLDFLVLTPLPLRPGQLLRAKAAALGFFLGSFLIAGNLLGIFMLPVVSKGVFWRMVWAHSIAVCLAGLFAGAAVMALGGLCVCVLPPGLFRRLSPVLQMLATAVLAMLVIHYARFGDEMASPLEHPGRAARCIPTFWFVGLYDRLLHGKAAQGFAWDASQRAWQSTVVALTAAVLVYPFAWVRMQRRAIQGELTRGEEPVHWWAQLQDRCLPRPRERAVFSFIGKTLMRNSRYQVYLAIYGGVGLALSAACAFTFREGGGGLRLAISAFGLHAALPLLLYWLIAGLRMAFAVPQNLPARWIFRVGGVEAAACARATRHWVMLSGFVLIAVFVTTLAAFGWGWRSLLVQGCVGACFCAVLVQGFFLTQGGAPFTRPRSPGKTSLPAVLSLYLGVLPPLLFCIAWAELRMEHRLLALLIPVLLVALLKPVLHWVRERLVWIGEESEGPDGEIQLLGLAGELRS